MMRLRTKIGCTLLLALSLGACGGSTPGGAAPTSRERAAYGGDSAGAEAVSVQSEDESYDGVDSDSMPVSPGPAYEAEPSDTGASYEQQTPPPRAPAPARPQQPTETTAGVHPGGGSMGGEAMIDVGPRFDRLLSLQSDLGGVLALSTPNCPRAHDLEEAICELSEHICTIADDNPDAREARTRCRDGRDRCERAREQVSEGCGG